VAFHTIKEEEEKIRRRAINRSFAIQPNQFEKQRRVHSAELALEN